MPQLLEIGFDVSDEFLLRVIFPVTAFCIGSLIVWVAVEVRRLVHTVEKHTRLLYGETDIEEWEGLIRMCVNTKRGEINNKQTLITLIRVLIREKVILMDDDLKDSVDKLKDR